MPLFQTRLFLRIISKSREVYILKIVTLAIAFACTTLIILFALNEFGYDRFHNDHATIFRMLQRNNDPAYNSNRLSNRIPRDILTRLKSYPGVSLTSRVKVLDEISIKSEKGIFENQKVHAADTSITSIFSFAIVDGAVENFKANTVLLSASAAQTYFGTTNVAGKKLYFSTSPDTLTYTIAGVYKDYPQNSQEVFNVFVSFDSKSIHTLRFHADDTGVYGKMNAGYPVKADTVFAFKNIFYRIQPLTDIYFGPRVLGEDASHGDSYSIILLIAITGLIFFLALTSFINLTTLTLPYRSKELAIKKLAGTSQMELVTGFARESFAIVGISLLLGILLLIATSDILMTILSIDLTGLLLQGNMILIVVLGTLALTLGIAPLFLTFRFIRATPNRLLGAETITFPRFKRVITFLQLGISIFLIVASMVIRRQVNYSLLKEPGRNHDQIVYMRYPADLTNEGLRRIRKGWKESNANIVDVMGTSQLPDRISSKELNSGFYFMSVDPAFRDFFELRMTGGNWFNANSGDSVIVVNEAGKQLAGADTANVIGVFSDFSGQFNQPQKPVKINIAPYFNYNFLCVRILEVDIRRTMNYLSTFYDRSKTEKVSYLNKHFEEWLAYQDRLNSLSEVLAIISGLLSCFAIYGLSVSIVRDKLKQIAIHKLCGASIANITRLLIKEFVRQMIVAILIFGPVTYIVVKELLRSFVYTTHFTWLDPVIPLAYCGTVITLLCAFQALSLNREDLSGALKG